MHCVHSEGRTEQVLRVWIYVLTSRLLVAKRETITCEAKIQLVKMTQFYPKRHNREEEDASSSLCHANIFA